MAMAMCVVITTLATICALGSAFVAQHEQQDVGSPLRVAQCRATCLERFSVDGPNGESMCLQGPDCFMCWENCELLQSNFQVWGAMCEEKEICFPGCQEACRFHAEASTHGQQTQPVIHTKGEGVIHVSGALARWPRPSTASRSTPLVYVVMRKSATGPWRQIIQTLDLTTRVPVTASEGAMLRVLVVDAQGLVTIYSPDEASARDIGRKRKKSVNTEIKATTARSVATAADEPWLLREVSLIHQKVLVIGEIAWEPKSAHGVYLVTWEVDGGGLKGNLFTDSTCVTLSLWPDTIYHIQVELVARPPAIHSRKSEMMDLDTGRAQKVSTEMQEPDEGDHRAEEEEEEEEQEDVVDFNSPLLSVLVSAVKGEHARHRWRNVELVTGTCAAILLFAVVLAITVWRCRCRRREHAMHTSGRKLIDDYTGFQPIMTVVGHSNEPTRLIPPPPPPSCPTFSTSAMAFFGAPSVKQQRRQQQQTTSQHESNVQV